MCDPLKIFIKISSSAWIPLISLLIDELEKLVPYGGEKKASYVLWIFEHLNEEITYDVFNYVFSYFLCIWR